MLRAVLSGHGSKSAVESKVSFPLSHTLDGGETFTNSLRYTNNPIGAKDRADQWVCLGHGKYLYWGTRYWLWKARTSVEREHGETLSILRTIKVALDPENRMNPGKMIPPAA